MKPNNKGTNWKSIQSKEGNKTKQIKIKRIRIKLDIINKWHDTVLFWQGEKRKEKKICDEPSRRGHWCTSNTAIKGGVWPLGDAIYGTWRVRHHLHVGLWVSCICYFLFLLVFKI